MLLYYWTMCRLVYNVINKQANGICCLEILTTTRGEYMKLTIKEVEKECREAARKEGLTFKRDKSLKINNSSAYAFYDRKTGEKVRYNLTLGMSYNIVCSEESIK